MPLILDNIALETERELLTTLGASYRLDAAIGYFNLRGWKLLAEAADAPRSGPNARTPGFWSASMRLPPRNCDGWLGCAGPTRG